MLSPQEEREIRQEARRSVRAQAGFRWHLMAFVLVSLLLAVINLVTTPLLPWCLFPIGGWAIGVTFHRFALSGRGRHEEHFEAEVQRLTERRERGSSR